MRLVTPRVTVTETAASITITQVVTTTANAAPNAETPRRAAGVAAFCMSLVLVILSDFLGMYVIGI